MMVILASTSSWMKCVFIEGKILKFVSLMSKVQRKVVFPVPQVIFKYSP